MKMSYKYIPLSALILAMGLHSCKNADKDFDDYEGGVTVYFPYQTPVRTLVMGEDTYNTDLDNAHKCKISTTMGGAYKGRNIKVDIAKDESILTDIYFAGGDKIEAMPENYYTLSSTTMNFDGNMSGSVEVSFSDAFFEDEKAVTGGYVIPLVIVSQTGADAINTGSYDTELYSTAPQRTNKDAWDKLPMDYTLFCVKYISKYEGYFMRRITNFNGKDSIHVVGLPELPDYPVAVSNFRYQQGNDSIRKYYIMNSKEPIVNTKTVNLNKVTYTAEINDEDAGFENKKYNLVLDFAAGTIAAPDGATYTVSGTCEYKDHSEKKAWGNKDRDGMYIDYIITDGANSISVKETLVAQRRGVKLETFDFNYNKTN
jgi:hypothetical protein